MGEAAACSTVNLIRFLLLFKTAPYQEELSGNYVGTVEDNTCNTLFIYSMVVHYSTNTNGYIFTFYKFNCIFKNSIKPGWFNSWNQ